MNLEIERYPGELRELRARVAAIDMLPGRVDETPKYRHDAPITIYLQVCDDIHCEESFHEHHDVTWCEDQINDTDIKYVRADVATRLREESK